MARTLVRSELGPHRGSWDRLVAAAALPTPFLRSWWLEASRHPRPRFVLVLDEDELLGGMALQEDHVLGIPCYRVLGHGWLAPDHLDVVAAPDRRDHVESALQRWCRRPGARIFDLEGVAEDTGFTRILPPPTSVTPMTVAPYRPLEVPTDGERPEPSGRARTASRRGRRQLAKLGGEHRVVRGAAVDTALERFRDLHDRRWHEGSGFSPLYERFAAAARVGARRDEVVVHELLVGGDVYASLVEFHLAGRVSFYQHGHDPDAPFRSPGAVVMSYALEHAAASGAVEYDLLRGTESYKGDWADGERTLLRVRSANGDLGRAALWALRTRQALGERKGRARRRLVRAAGDAGSALRTAAGRARSIAARATSRLSREPGNTRILTDPAELAALRDEWGSLRADPPSPNTQLDHVLAMATTLGDDEEPCVVTVHDREGRLTGAAPLARARARPRRVRLLDQGAAGGFLYADEHELGRLVDAVLALGCPVTLDALVEGTPTDEAIRTRSSRWLVRQSGWLGGPSLPVDGSFTQPMEKLSRGRRKDLTRSLRRAQDLGEVRFETELPGDRVASCLDELIQVEARSWKAQAGSALVQDDAQREALRRYLTAPSVRDSVIVTRVLIGGQTAAIDIGVVVGDRYWGLKGGVDDAYKRGAPGLHLKVHSVGVAAEEGVSRVEFMGSTAQWKEMWGAGPTPLRRWRLYPPNPRGAVAVTSDLIAKASRELGRRPRERDDSASQAPSNPGERPLTDREAARQAMRRPGVDVPAGSGRSVRVLTEPDELEALRPEWSRLQAEVPGPSSQLDWVLAFAWGLPRKDQLCVVAIHERGRLTGVAPLVRRGGIVRRLELVILGASGLLYRDSEQAARLVDAVLGLPLPLQLDLLVTGSPTERLVTSQQPRGRLTRISARDGGGSVQLDERHAEDPIALLGRNVRKDLRRRRRRAEEVGELRFETIAPKDDVELLRRLFDDLVRIEARGWKGRAGTALASDDRRREMAWRHTSAQDVRGQVRICTLHIGDELVAVDLSLVSHGRWWCEKSGYDEAYARFSPGHLLTAYAVQCAAQEGCTTLELGGIAEPYKESWAPPLPLTSVKTYPASPAGLVAVLADAGAKARRDLVGVRPRLQELSAGAIRRIRSSMWGRMRAQTGDPEGQSDSRTEVIRDAAGVEALRGEWDRLGSEVPGPSSQLDYLRASALTPQGDTEPAVVTVRDGGHLGAVAPLVRTSGWPPRLRLATSEATEFLYADRQQLERLVDEVLGFGLPLTFETLLADSPTDVALRERAGRRGLVLTSTRRGGPSMALDDGLAEPLDRLSGGRRSDLRRKYRRAEEMGRVEFDVSPVGDDLAERFDEFVRIEAAGWKGRAGTALAHAEEQREQLWRYLASPAVRSNVWVARMLIDAVPVAVDLAVVAERRYWFVKGCYDERYADCSPGMLLKVHTVGWAARRGLDRFEFMGETEPYKEAWGADPQTLRTFRFYPFGVAGLAAFSRDAVSKIGRVAGRQVRRVAGG